MGGGDESARRIARAAQVEDLNLQVPGLRIVSWLGEGGMGVVYKAFDEARSSWIAIKTVRRIDPGALVRFKREFRMMQDLQHPNLVSLGELVSTEKSLYFTMELVEGDDFVTYVRPRGGAGRRLGGRAPPEDAGNSQYPTGNPSDVSELGPTRRFAQTNPADGGNDEGFDELRLRHALRQLAEALTAVHEAGLVHRDVKPSNVLVSRSGRVVLLDFGLAGEVRGKSGGTESRVLGTPEYMAPEQGLTGRVGPEADWYSVGTMLFEALTGTLPFHGSTLQMLMQKQDKDVAPPGTLTEGIPPDLDQLCHALLRFDPKARASGRDVLRTLGVLTAPRSQASSLVDHPVFVGRERELGEIRTAFERTRSVGAVSVVLAGDSGVGKSTLARHALRVLVDEHPDLVVFSGRCYATEAVPYKALDGIVDALAKHLARLGPEADAFRPTHVMPLLHLFPVLGHIEAFANAPRRGEEAVDPREVRTRAFAGLRELFTRFADRHPTILSIDDIQWADRDSLALLAEILRPPQAPSLLVLCTQRGTALEGTGKLTFRALEDDVLNVLPGDVRAIRVSPMGDVEACELARQLLERVAPTHMGIASTIAEEAEGLPLFIDALVRHAALEGTDLADVHLDDALRARIDRLPPGASRLLELLTVASLPVAQDVLFGAAGGEHRDYARDLKSLRVSHLVAAHGQRGTDVVEVYHDRVRSAVAQRLDREMQRDCHRRLARAMERAGARDLESLALHWRGAGEAEKAAEYALRAGDDAARALAFDRAARLFKLGLELWPQGQERRAILEKLGNALSNAGLGAQAAAAYQEAAVGAQGANALDLRRRAAEQLLRCGHLDDGLAATREVLESVRIPYPRTALATIAMFLVLRAFLRLRGLGFRRRDETEVAATELTRIDVCMSVASNLAIVETIRGSAFQACALLLALRAGEPYRVALSFAYETGYVAIGGSRSWRRTQRAITRAETLAKQVGHPRVVGLCATTASIAHYLAGRFREAVTLSRAAQEQYRDRCTGVAWEVDTSQLFELNALAQLGELAELAVRGPIYVRDALDRGDLYGAVSLRIGFPNLRWLVADNPKGARKELRDAMKSWSKQGFHLEHFYELLAWTNADLYDGREDEAWKRLGERWPAIERSLLVRIQSLRILAWNARGRVALAGAARGRDTAAMLAIAKGSAKRILREKTAWGAPLAALVQAGAARLEGREEIAVARLRAASAGFDAVGMALHGAAARASLASLVGGDEGKTIVAATGEWFKKEGVVRPERLVALTAPGAARR